MMLDAIDAVNEVARLLAAPIETDPMRELRVVVNARLQTNAIGQDRARKGRRVEAARYYTGQVDALEWVLGVIDDALANPEGVHTDTEDEDA